MLSLAQEFGAKPRVVKGDDLLTPGDSYPMVSTRLHEKRHACGRTCCRDCVIVYFCDCVFTCFHLYVLFSCTMCVCVLACLNVLHSSYSRTITRLSSEKHSNRAPLMHLLGSSAAASHQLSTSAIRWRVPQQSKYCYCQSFELSMPLTSLLTRIFVLFCVRGMCLRVSVFVAMVSFSQMK